MRRLTAGVCLLLLTGCGLPLVGGVQDPGPVPAEQRQGGDVQVLPPGPRDDATPIDIVRDFYGAQSNPADGHASAREFLASTIRSSWRDTGPVSVFAAGLDISAVEATDAFRVRGALVGHISADGSYSPDRGRIDVLVRVGRGPRGRPVINAVPDGLLLSTADRDRSFRPRKVYFLAPAVTPTAAASHLVPDQQFLPVTADSADALVRRLVAGPSRQLGDSALTAFPVGTTVRSVRTDASGVVTVDLSAQVGKAKQVQREQMSAQLVWTLRGITGAFRQLRLLSNGRPVGVGPPTSEIVLQDSFDFASYDPDGLSPRAPLYYVGGHRLRVLEPTTGPAADASGRQFVDAAAASPRGGGLALLARVRGATELRTGPTTGPFVLRARGASVTSPTWGSGEQGVWFLAGGRLMLAPLSGQPVGVPVDGVGRYGRLDRVRVSRDGVRIAVVAGAGTKRRLLVGRVVDRAGALRVVGLRDVAPNVADVRDLSWDSATSLVVLGQIASITTPVRVAVDGSSVTLVNKLGLELSAPAAVAAAPRRPLVVGAVFERSTVLFRDNGARLVREQGIVGVEPFYPG